MPATLWVCLWPPPTQTRQDQPGMFPIYEMLQDWTLSFMFPSLIVASVGFLVFLFLVPKPSHVGLGSDAEVHLYKQNEKPFG